MIAGGVILISGGGSVMITDIHFETFASGMKARLDPTYRLLQQSHALPDNTEMLKGLAWGNRNAALPFTTVRKSSVVYSHKV